MKQVLGGGFANTTSGLRESLSKLRQSQNMNYYTFGRGTLDIPAELRQSNKFVGLPTPVA